MIGDLLPLTDNCPDCKSVLFYPGPRGGMAINVKCAGCGATFNYCGPLMSQRIGPASGVYKDNPLTLGQLDALCGLTIWRNAGRTVIGHMFEPRADGQPLCAKHGCGWPRENHMLPFHVLGDDEDPEK